MTLNYLLITRVRTRTFARLGFRRSFSTGFFGYLDRIRTRSLTLIRSRITNKDPNKPGLQLQHRFGTTVYAIRSHLDRLDLQNRLGNSLDMLRSQSDRILIRIPWLNYKRIDPVRFRERKPVLEEEELERIRGKIKNLQTSWKQMEDVKAQTSFPDPKTPEIRAPPRDPYLPFVSKTWDSVYGAVSTLNIFSKNEKEIKKKEVKKKMVEEKKEPEKVITKSAVDLRTRSCVQALKCSMNSSECLSALDSFCRHLHEFHFAKGVAVREGVVGELLYIRRTADNDYVRLLTEEALQLIGYHGPTPGMGIRILSMDGGGMRGVVALEVLREIEKVTGQPMYKLFDFVCGVSTGAIIAAFLSFKKLKIDQIDELYAKFGQKVFSQSMIAGATGWVRSHSYYNTRVLEDTLKHFAGENKMIDTIRSAHTPRTAMISTLVSEDHIRPYVFRNYHYPYRTQSFYRGSAKYAVWEAIRASSAAPGYFDEMPLNGKIHHDGGILTNNASALAIHEATRLWPGERLQCVVSLGMGRNERPFANPTSNSEALSLAQKFTRIVDAATDTEISHVTLHDLLPGSVYFRMNPYMSDYYTMEETRPEKLAAMREDAQMYVRRNQKRLEQLCQQLVKGRGIVEKGIDILNEGYVITKEKFLSDGQNSQL